jgi:hypothetical protein
LDGGCRFTTAKVLGAAPFQKCFTKVARDVEVEIGGLGFRVWNYDIHQMPTVSAWEKDRRIVPRFGVIVYLPLNRVSIDAACPLRGMRP